MSVPDIDIEQPDNLPCRECARENAVASIDFAIYTIRDDYNEKLATEIVGAFADELLPEDHAPCKDHDHV
jgi:hypothetical protein